MGQYCRYCDFCFKVKSKGIYYCSQKRIQVSTDKLVRKNKCHDFVLSEAGCVMTGKPYKRRPSEAEQAEAMRKGLGFDPEGEEVQTDDAEIHCVAGCYCGPDEEEKDVAEGVS